MKQGKPESMRAAAMWILMMMVIILLRSHLSIAAQDHDEKKINGTNNNNDNLIGIIENNFDSEEFFPDAISSHFHGRVLAGNTQQVSRAATSNPNPAVKIKQIGDSYRGSSPINPNSVGGDQCKGDSTFKRTC